jgi:hypothetical protein
VAYRAGVNHNAPPMPTEAEIARAELAGRFAADLGMPVTACPYSAIGDGRQRVLARRFVVGYVSADPPSAFAVDYSDA